MNDLERKIKVMQAFADGKPIQCRLRIRRDGEWASCNAPLWDWHQWDYRVKPDDAHRKEAKPLRDAIAFIATLDGLPPASDANAVEVRVGLQRYLEEHYPDD